MSENEMKPTLELRFRVVKYEEMDGVTRYGRRMLQQRWEGNGVSEWRDVTEVVEPF